MKCEGACEEHIGEIVRVHIISQNGHDWGEFWYCEEAIAEDKRRGFIVRSLTPAAPDAALLPTRRCKRVSDE